MSEKVIPYKIYLEESEMPTAWYNLRADMKNKPAPLLDPNTKQPMTEAELQHTVCSAARKGGYKYTNARLIEFLDITPEEQDAIGLHPFTGVYKPWSHAKPNATRDAVRKARREGRDGQIIAMHRDGISQAETARLLNISRNTVAKVLKEWREQVQEADLAIEQENLLNSGATYDCLLARPQQQGGSVSTGNGQATSPLLTVVKRNARTKGDDPPGSRGG